MEPISEVGRWWIQRPTSAVTESDERICKCGCFSPDSDGGTWKVRKQMICQHLFNRRFAWTGWLTAAGRLKQNEQSQEIKKWREFIDSCKLYGPGWVRENTTKSSSEHGVHNLQVYWKESARQFSAALDNVEPSSHYWSGRSPRWNSGIRAD